jgi:hypothetical protein
MMCPDSKPLHEHDNTLSDCAVFLGVFTDKSAKDDTIQCWDHHVTRRRGKMLLNWL